MTHQSSFILEATAATMSAVILVSLLMRWLWLSVVSPASTFIMTNIHEEKFVDLSCLEKNNLHWSYLVPVLKLTGLELLGLELPRLNNLD